MTTEDQWNRVPDQKERRDKLLNGETVLINRNKDKLLLAWATKNKLTTYIGRGNNCIWGNPFSIGNDGNRSIVCDKHSEYLDNSPHLLDKIQTLNGRGLVCFCYPKRCHGNNLINKILPNAG